MLGSLIFLCLASSTAFLLWRLALRAAERLTAGRPKRGVRAIIHAAGLAAAVGAAALIMALFTDQSYSMLARRLTEACVWVVVIVGGLGIAMLVVSTSLLYMNLAWQAWRNPRRRSLSLGSSARPAWSGWALALGVLADMLDAGAKEPDPRAEEEPLCPYRNQKFLVDPTVLREMPPLDDDD